MRADAFGLTNTPHFANPDATCPASATTPGPVAGSGGLCNTGSTITSELLRERHPRADSSVRIPVPDDLAGGELKF